MTLSFILGCLWVIAANVIAMLPTKDHHWRAAYILMGVGAPLLVWVIWENGWLIGGLFLLAAASILRWPVIYAYRWLRRKTGPS